MNGLRQTGKGRKGVFVYKRKPTQPTKATQPNTPGGRRIMAGPAAIPASLAKYGPEILAGVAAAERRRAELAQAWGYPARQPAGRVEFAKPAPQPAIKPKPQTRQGDQQPVKFWPLLGITAARSEAGGAWRAWTLAKSLDLSGRGAIPRADLMARAKTLGIHAKTWRRWISQARGYGLFTDVQRKTGDWWFILAGQAAAARALGCQHVGARPASIAAGDLIGQGWRAYVWAAYEATHMGKPISRAKQLELTGVPISTQRASDNQAGVDRRPNYAVSQKGADNLPGVMEFENRAAPFKFWDKQARRWVIAWRLPDSRTTGAAEIKPAGRSRKINRAIKHGQKHYDGLSILGQPLGCIAGDLQAWRLFHRTDKQAKALERKLARADLQPTELYLFQHDSPNTTFWTVIPQRG